MAHLARRITILFVALAVLLLGALPASAGSALSSTGGCTAMGQSNVTGTGGYTETNAAPYGGCNWTYSIGVFTVSGVDYVRGPGWQHASYAYSDTSSLGTVTVSRIVGTHNLCTAGGPCLPPGSQPWATTY